MAQQPKMQEHECEFLELIPPERLSSQQKAYRDAFLGKKFPFYKFKHEPSHLADIDWDKYRNVAIWRENETLICLCDEAKMSGPHLGFTLCPVGKFYNLNGIIYGGKDSAIAETATFFWSLKHKEGVGASLTIKAYKSKDAAERAFDFTALRIDQLLRIFDANWIRLLTLQTGNWSSEQSWIITTRSYPIILHLSEKYDYPAPEIWNGLCFEDGGTAFNFPFSKANLQRLCQLDHVIESLTTRSLDDERALIPFSAKVNTLDHSIDSKYVQPEDLDGLNVVASNFTATFNMNFTGTWSRLMIPFLSRIAELGHFKSLSVTFMCISPLPTFQDAIPVVEALIGAINGNPELEYFNLTDMQLFVDWLPYWEEIFQAMEKHEGLRAVILREFPPEMYPDDDDDSERQPYFTLLEKLLSRNRNIEVYDKYGRISNGSSIDKIYSLNRLYNGSATLVKESTFLRPMLLVTALVETASAKFQYTSLLLSNHTDMLCELIETVNLENLPTSLTDDSSAVDASHQTERPKRKPQIQPPTVAKNATRDDT